MNGVSVDFLRNEWGSFFKWTVGLSIFMITASLTVLTFKNSFSLFNVIAAIVTTVTLFGNIFLTLFFLGRTLFRIYVSLFNQSQGRIIQGRVEEQFKRLVNNAKCYERLIMISFTLGFIAFITFLMGFILRLNWLKI